MKLWSELILITLVLMGCGGGGGGGTGAASTDQTVTASKDFIDTGISADMCYGANSDTLMKCTSKEATNLNSQQDGMVGLDVSKSDNNDGKLGFSYSLVPNTKGGNYDKTECVKDNITGLMWEGKPADSASDRDYRKSYTNYVLGSLDAENNVVTVVQLKQSSNAQGYVEAVNATGLCGYKDWRLPTRTELLSLVNFGVANADPLIDIGFFKNTQLGGYWTSTAYAESSVDSAWIVYFYIDDRPNDANNPDLGGVDIAYRGTDGGFYVRLVRKQAL